MVRIGTTIRTELTDLAISQPRISPKGDQIAFTVVNTKTGKHDIYLMSDQGGPATNLTNMPDAENTDPVWSRDGSHLAFVSDRGVDVDRRNNKDIWIIDLAHPERPIQVTTNGSVDDSPAWDSTGANLYFRSNRGGAWGIWKTGVR
jgi:Tol biopolymer transport system component